MNVLEVRSELREWYDGRLSLMAEVWVDGEPLANFAVYVTCLSELERSVWEEGRFDILTCTCGIPACVGIVDGIRVSRKDGVVRWIICQPGPRRELRFDAAAYQRVVQEGIGRARRNVADLWESSPDDPVPIVPSIDEPLLRPRDRSQKRR